MLRERIEKMLADFKLQKIGRRGANFANFFLARCESGADHRSPDDPRDTQSFENCEASGPRRVHRRFSVAFYFKNFADLETTLLAQCRNQTRQFLRRVRRIIQSLPDFRFDQFAKAAAQTMDPDFDRAFVHAELSRGIGLRKSIAVAGEPGFERFKLV
jgi:hypothetical protein